MRGDTVYAIFDDCDACCYLCFILDEVEEEYLQMDLMTDADWEEFLETELD